jgi:hypothetical protein
MEDKRMRLKLIAIALLLSHVCVAMAQPVISLRQAELTKHSFYIGQLRLTVEKFDVGHSSKLNGRLPYICVKVENQSDSAVVFDPQSLSLINKGTDQVDAVASRSGNPSGSPPPLPMRKVLPGAFIRECYLWDHLVNLPARLFYDGKELAVITE